MKNLYIILITVFLFQTETKLTAQNPLPLNPKNINTEAEVGTLSGTFAVGQTGAATYTIPIDLPEGRAGMTPELGLVYSSQQGNNVMGQGWHISGFSSISRTNTTTYYNGEIDNVDFDGDQFVLDGQRLIEINDWGNKVEYRTEIDGISKIIYYKIKENPYDNDHHFKIFTKSGLIKEYGNSPTSKQYYGPGNDDGIPLIWHLNKISDRKDNTINYIYVQTPNYGEIHPSMILYTGYEVDGKQKDDLGFYTIDFTYDDINVPIGLQSTAYFEKNGQEYLNRNIKRLNQITISYLSTTIKIYKFTYYEDKGVTNEFFLKDVTLQVPTDQGFKSLNPTVFSWDFYLPQYDKEVVFESQNFPISISPSPPVIMKKFDYNGDGKDEIIVYKAEYDLETQSYDKNIYIYSRYFYDFIIPISSLDFYYGEFNGADFDNNGDDELIVSDDNGFSIYDFIKEPSGTSWYYEEVYNKNESGKPKALDINGDGLTDCFLISGNQGKLYLGTGDPNNFFIEDNPPIFIPLLDYYIYEYSDFNGDGKIDILTRRDYTNNFKIYSFNENNNTFEEISNLYLLNFNNDKIYFNDFNGDGKTDICHLTNNYNVPEKKIYFSYGDGFIDDPEPISTEDFPDFGYPIVADFNNDNRADFIFIWYIDQGPLWQDVKTLYIKIFYTQPDGLHHVYSYNEEYLMDEYGEDINSIAALALADIKGNGSMDFAIEFQEDGPQGFYNDYLHLYYFTDDNDNNNGNFIKTIENGFGSQLNITYMPFNTSYVNTSYNYPLSKLVAKTYLVDEVWQINESGEKINHQKFTFTNPLMHKAGKGFLGFQNTTIKNYQNNTITSAEFSIFAENDLYFHPYPENIKQHSFINNQRETDKLLMETYNTFNIKTTITDKPKIYLPVITQSLQKVWDNDDNNTFIKTVKTIQIIDDIDIYGNILKNTVLADPSSEPGSNFDFKTIVENSYIIDVDNWLVGRPLSSEGTNSYINDNEDNFVRTDYTYYQEGEATWPLLKFKKITPNYDTKYETEVWYVYDEYGNITKETLKAPNADPYIAERVTEYEYSTENGYNARFLTKTIKNINGVEYETQYEYYKEIGKLKKEIVLGGPVPLETTYEYDDFGKLQITNHPDGTSSETCFHWSEGNDDAPLNALFYTINQKRMADPTQTEYEKVITFYDKLERDLLQVTYGLNNEKIYVNKEYNAKGQLWKVSEPYFSTSSPRQWTVFEYDKLGRKKTTTTPANSYTYDYCGKKTTTTNNGTQISVSKTVNAIGNIESVEDPAGPVSYEYYSSGNVKSINALGSIYSMEYDPAGNQNKLIDPNAGTIIYKYNTFGELIKQTDAKNNTYTMQYDNLGRIITKTLASTGQQTVYDYYEDQGYPGFGLLRSVSVAGKSSISYIYGYDDLNRLHSKTVSAFNEAFVTQYTYDGPTGRLKSHIYPTGFSVFYEYTNSGHLRAVKKTGSGETLWEANTANARGQLTDFTLGNGLSTHKDFDDYGLPKTIITGNVQDLEYSFDPVTGNLNYRKDHIFNLVENFEYDNLLKTRLIEWEVYGLDNYSIEYENNGNIHIKTDVTNIQTLPKGEYVYGQNAGQHAVTSIFKPTEEYLLKATPPQTIEYTPFNKTKSISKTVIEHDKTHIYRMDISYGPYQKRKATQFYKDKTLLSSKCFIGDNYEIETERDGTKRKLHYLSGGDGLFAIYESKDGENKMYYIHKDYLGSYETVTDEQGVIWDKLSFDPWGRRRNPFTWLYEDTPIPAIFDRGYTGHEHLDKFELINMGGRVYDPVLARFLSPDPFVQAPEYGQNYNRYSYAFNNPLKFTDPNGEFGFLIFVGLSALMSAALSGSQPDGSFDWGEAGKGAFIGVAMPVGMMGSVLAPFSPALLGVSGALGSAAIAGSAMFGSVTLTTGATSFATNGTFSPNLKAAGISAGITALFAGIEGGIRAANDNRNFWTGEIEIDPFIIGKQDVQSSYLNTAQKYNSSAARETHDKLLKLRYEDTFSFKDGDFDISKLTTGTSRKIGYTPSGSFINTKTGELYAGYFNRATKAIHISLKTLFSKEIIFKSIAGHELIHAYHHSIIPNMLSLYTERVAYQYTYNVLMMGGEYNKAASKFWYMSIKGYFGEYPASYNLPTYYSFW